MMPPVKKLNPILVCTLAAFLVGCGAKIMSYAPTSTYSENDFREINDEDILKAFQAKPQLCLPARVAWYNLSRDSLLFFIQTSDSTMVAENYLVPKTLIEGFQPLFETPYDNYYSAKPIDFKAVRLLAARAKCDIVVLVMSRFAEERDLNPWAILNALILPAFFTPYYHVEYKYSSEVFIFDVRNGYMYRHLKFDDDRKEYFVNLWNVNALARDTNIKMIRAASVYLKNELHAFFKNSVETRQEESGPEEKK
jgi:hypothetical protein